MFDKNFFPTPENVIRKMLEGLNNLDGFRILEPSAGKGDIVDYILKYKTYRTNKTNVLKKVCCIEKNVNLQNILRGKNYKIVADDFLNYNTDYIFDYIIMNPPFDNGVKHLLKAWDISNGAEIRCLLNAESVRNLCTKERILLDGIIKENGKIEFLGQAFKNAERKTNVEVALVTLKDEKYKSKFSFFGEKEVNADISFEEKNELQLKDVYGNMEIRYNKVKSLMEDMLKTQSEIEFYSKGLVTGSKDINDLIKGNQGTNKNAFYTGFLEEFRSECWKTLFSKTKIRDLTTKKVKQDFQEMQDKQGDLAFTKDNIIDLYEQLFQSRGQIMVSCIEEAFDLMTKYYDENRVYIEGWKTNDQWKVNRKVILPRSRDNWFEYPKLNWEFRDILEDIEKSMCFIMKKDYKSINSVYSVIFKANSEAEKQRDFYNYTLNFGAWYDSEFFRFKMFKKGTIHLEFKDKYLYEQFNIIACKNKNWLGN